MADKGTGIPDGSSPTKRNDEGYVWSSNQKRKRTNHLDSIDDDDDASVEDVSGHSNDDVFNTDEINVKMPSGNIMTFKVKGSDTVGSIKVKIQAKKRIRFDHQELIFNEVALENSDTLANLLIKNESTLTLMRKSTGFIKIFIKTPEGELTDSLYVKPNITIGDIKTRIYVCRFDDVLIFNDIVLDDSGTLSDFNVMDGSTLTRISKSMGDMEIFVNMCTGKTVSFVVNPTYTIGEVKDVIESEEKIPHVEQVLIFNNMVLGDEGTLFDFDVNRNSTLMLMHKPRGFSRSMRVFIKTLYGEIFTLEVKPSDTIGDVKTKIQDKVDVPRDEQELIFNEMVLSDVGTVADFHIIKESTLILMRIKSGFMSILVKSYTGKSYNLDVRPSDTVRDVKSKILKKERPFYKLSDLIFNGKRLEDNATLADYHIHKESIVYFETGGVMKVLD